jgi:hypothetical protein
MKALSSATNTKSSARVDFLSENAPGWASRVESTVLSNQLNGEIIMDSRTRAFVTP